MLEGLQLGYQPHSMVGCRTLSLHATGWDMCAAVTPVCSSMHFLSSIWDVHFRICISVVSSNAGVVFLNTALGTGSWHYLNSVFTIFFLLWD